MKCKIKKNCVVIGLTGGIGSGKSAVCDILIQLNAYIIDADIVARESGGEIENAIKSNFPEYVQNGILDRASLKQAVFNNKNLLKKLNSISHPLIFKRINSQIKEGINIVAVPLLFESGYNEFCDYILGISASKNTKIKRVLSRDNIDINTINQIIDAQINQEQMLNRCDFVIENDGNLQQLKQKVEVWWTNVKQAFG